MDVLENGTKLCSADVAFEETLDLLEWSKLCEQLSTFACTTQGRRKCKNIDIPSSFLASKAKLNETLELLELDNIIDGGLSFSGVNDLESILWRCYKGGIVSGEELLEVAETLRAARRLRRQIDDSLLRPSLTALLDGLTTLPELEKTLEFGLEKGGRIADRASEKLSRLRVQLNELRIKRRDILQDLIRKYSPILQDTNVAYRHGRPVLALKLSAVDQISGMIHDTSASGNTIFLEPQPVISLGNRMKTLETLINAEEQHLLRSWSKAVGEKYSSIDSLCKTLLELETGLARARYGAWLNGVAPILVNESDASFEVRKFRHPLLIWQEQHHAGHAVIPISFEISTTVRVVTITGPNTGGKTIALKSIGLAILMARCGMFLPCTGNPSLPWCNQVLADIGDEQSLQQNLSTFSGHIIRIERILDAISQRPGPTIVLLDEVGAGTDPIEGTAIAISLLRVLANRVRLTIATTHFGELKTLKYNDTRFENASVAFDDESIMPTYKLQWGIPGRSNAIAIAIRLGLDQEVTTNAKKIVAPLGGDDVNNVIRGLELQRERQQRSTEDAAALLARAELLHEELLTSWQEQVKFAEERRQLSRDKLAMSIKAGQKEVKELIERLRQKGADGEMARKAGQRLRQIGIEFDHQSERKRNIDWQPQVGERVKVISLNKSGEVIAVSEDGMQLTVLCGVFRSTVELSLVESLDGRKPTLPETFVDVNIQAPKNSSATIRTKSNTIDVRGLRVHEAEIVVEEALRNSSGKVWVIHGIGTGKLKKGLCTWLQTLPYVEKITDAEQNDGGVGCSVIWLK